MKKINRKGDILASEVLKLVLAALCIIALVYLAVVMFGLLQAKTQTEQARGTLDELAAKSNLLQSGEQAETLIVAPKGWFIISFERASLVKECTSNFCICMCDNAKCDSSVVCRGSDKFVLLRDVGGNEVRMLEKEAPFSVKYTKINEKVYPYSALFMNVQDLSAARTAALAMMSVVPPAGLVLYFVAKDVVSGITPLFFKFDSNSKEWEWSPDLSTWMKTDTLTVSGGIWIGKQPAKNNIDFINKLNKYKNSEEEGKNVLQTAGARLSDGVIAMQSK